MNHNAWIIGATTGLGRMVAEQLALRGVSLVLSARNERDLEALCADLTIRYQSKTTALQLDLSDFTNVAASQTFISQFNEKFDFPDSCFLLAGSINENDESLQSADLLNTLMQQNFMGPVFLINELIKQKPVKPFRVVVASSVAAARARGKNIAYGTAKRALEQYCSGLMHALSNSNTTIHIYRFGYIDTNLSYGQKLPFKPADPTKIALQLIADQSKGPGTYYRPGYWWFIVFVLNLIPFQIYRKLKF